MVAVQLRRWLERAAFGRWRPGLALIFNLPFMLAGVHRSAFDTYVHLFFADHYRAGWWSLWEPRWYLGFSVASYPPLVHQLIALLSWPLSAAIAAFAPGPEPYPGAHRLLGLEAGYVALLLAVLGLFPSAVHAFARVFVGPRAAGLAALLAVGLPALHLTGWAFGQLPTLAATAAVLGALARGACYLREGRPVALAQAGALAAVAGATHHAVFLFVPFGALAILSHELRRVGRAGRARFALRALTWAAWSALAVAAVLWPFLEWSRGQSLQVPIDHPSRYNFLLRPEATLLFFWPVHGPLLLLIPLLPGLLRRAPRLWPLALAWAALFALSLGGTTPLPRWLFGDAWAWLTYDRFGLWATAALLPPAGALLLLAGRRSQRTVIGFVAAVAITGALAGWASVIARAQPPPVDLAPIVRFLDEPAQRPYRYLTLGFGDQLARLSALTGNGSPDGAYHTARGLPELRASGLGALDGAVWNPQGVQALRPFLQNPERYGLRWIFSNHPAYPPVLRAAGWQFRFFVGDVMAWERADVKPLPITPPIQDRFAAAWWGTAPLAALALAAATMAWPTRRALTRARIAAALARLRRGLWLVTIALLSLWWVHVLRGGAGDLPQIYFVYQSVLVYAADLAAALTLGVWLGECGLTPRPIRSGPRAVALAGAGWLAAVALSALASSDRGLTLAFTLHLVLLAGWYVMLVDDPPDARTTALTFAAVVAAQSLVAVAQAVTQSTSWLAGLNLPWPGALTAETRGASVVADAGGARWLRAYGTLPHPNVLGTCLLIYLGGLLAHYLADGRRRWLWVLGLGTGALALTFSRAAWLGALALAGGAAWLVPAHARGRLKTAGAAASLVMIVTLVPLAGFLTTRLGVAGPANNLERASALERALLIGYSLDAWRAQPVTGVGAGAFPQWAARNTGAGYPFEPVHNAPLLILAETGVLGATAALTLAGAVAWRVWKRRRMMDAAEAVGAAVLLAILVTGLFDHLWWTQPPARLLAGLALAGWARETTLTTNG